MYSNKEEIEKFRKLNGPLIDLRSPGEYYKGHMPNSINIPLFNNEERSIIGTIYKRNGREKAVIKGLEFVEKKIELILNDLFNVMDIYSKKNIKNNPKESILRLYCARGGMRSRSISWLLDKFNIKNITLSGGYKRYRKWILDSFNIKWNLIIIGGKTGTGKTKLLKLLEKNNYQIIDLENLASHRGSTFGSLGMKEQPTNEFFENLIAEKLNSFNKFDQIFLEAESASIGKCKVPHELFKQMKKAKRIEIIKSKSERIMELINTYSVFNQDDLIDSVLRIKKRLGPQRTKIAIDSINKKNWELVCNSVLEYYDKCYEYEKVGKENITTIDMTNIEDENIIINSIKEFIKSYNEI